ncbi:MAG: hypothetical protein LBS49_00300 [Candidatus Accumulibacter sp.]|nr:hypothetical protein [Accumulibacter sp.]
MLRKIGALPESGLREICEIAYKLQKNNSFSHPQGVSKIERYGFNENGMPPP